MTGRQKAAARPVDAAPADADAGRGGSYVRDPVTGVRRRVAGTLERDEVAVPAVPVAGDEQEGV